MYCRLLPAKDLLQTVQCVGCGQLEGRISYLVKQCDTLPIWCLFRNISSYFCNVLSQKHIPYGWENTMRVIKQYPIS